MVLRGKPSQLLSQMINTICPDHPDLVGCCSAGLISGMWRKKLPLEVRQRIAGQSIVGKDAMKATLQSADAVFATLQAGPGASLAAIDLNDSADQPALQQVAAIRGHYRGRARSSYRGAGRGQPGSTRPPADRGDPHPDGPPTTACNLHWRYGRGAFKCRKPDSCPWRNYRAPKPATSN